MDSSLKGKSVAIVAMGASNADFIKQSASKGSQTQVADEVWAINSMAGVIQHDRVFMMDPVARFFDTELAGPMTFGMREWLPRHPGPIYTVALDPRAPGLKLYPITEVVAKIGVPYFNNTAAYAIAYAIANEVRKIELYGVDFSYAHDRHMAEAGRGCCEFLCGMAVRSFGIEIQVGPSSTFLDVNVPDEDRLYGYRDLPLYNYGNKIKLDYNDQNKLWSVVEVEPQKDGIC